MLTFLNSAILLGFAAIAVPILIHLFTRQKIRIVDFSSLRFLKELQKQKIRRLKLRQILLLILRSLFILALVMVFARPTLRQTASSSPQSGSQLTAVLILDNTLSMGRESDGRRLLDTAKKRALAVVDLMRPGDEIYLLYPQVPIRFAHEGPRYTLESIRDLIESTELSFSGTDFVGALAEAAQIMRNSANINKEVYLICDRQQSGLQLAQNGRTAALFDDSVRLYVLPVRGSSLENLSLASVEFGNQILQKDKVVEIRSLVKNPSDQAANNKLVHLFVNGKRVAQDAVSLEPGAAGTVTFRMVPDRTGKQSGYVLLEDDGLLQDNRRYFTFEIPDEIPVLLVGNRPDDTYFISLALKPDKKAKSTIAYKEILASELTQETFDDYSVVVLSNVPTLDNATSIQLTQYLDNGGGLMVFLGAEVDIRNYNENLHRKLGLPALTASVSSSDGQQFLSLGKIDFSHAIFENVFEEDQNVVSPHFRFAIGVNTSTPVDEIIEFSNGAPFLFEVRRKQGRILYVTTGVSSNWSDLALRGLFVPLVNRSVTYLAGATGQIERQRLVAEEITYGREHATELTMEKPDGSRLNLKPDVTRGNYVIRFRETDLAGVYKLYDEENLIAQWPVNFDPEESVVTEFDTGDLDPLAGEAQLVEVGQTDNIAQKLEESRFGRELWKLFAVLALGLLLAEMVIYREKGEPAEEINTKSKI